MARQKKEEKYRITPKGLVSLALNDNKDIWDDLELYCYRNGFNAVLFNGGGGEFIKVKRKTSREPCY